jgi:hypothetical protein
MRMTKRFLLLLCLFSAQIMVAQNTHYYILFSARFPTLRPFSIGGHAFITWRSEDSVHQKAHQFTYGFFPQKGMGIFRKVPAAIKEGYVKNSNRERLVRRFILEVDSLQYLETLQEVEYWKSQPYSLFNNNCIHFMNAIITRLCMKPVDTRTCFIPMKPYRYIKKLKKLNTLRIVKNDYLEKVRLRILKKGEIEDEKDDDDNP